MITLTSLFDPSSYALNPYFIPPTIVATLVLVLGIFIFSLERESAFNRSLLYLCVSSSLWLYGSSLVFLSRTEDVALFWGHLFYAGFILMPVTIFHIAMTYTKKYPQEQVLLWGAYGVSALMIAISLSRNFLDGVREYPWGFYPGAGAWQFGFLGYVLFFTLLGLLHLGGYYRSLSDFLEKKRTKFLIIAFIFTMLSYVDVLSGYGVKIYPFGYLAILCFVLSITYSIIKHNNLMVLSHAMELEKEVEEKTKTVAHFVAELRTTQLKLFETGKISALASLSAGILHQISQPITAIHGFVKFIKKEMKETDPFYKAISLMEEQSIYLKDMLEDLMELIRHREIRKENIDVNSSIKRATNLLTDELRIRRVDWDNVLEENLPKVYADAVHLQQIFMNIVINAVEALIMLPKGSKRYIRITSKYDRPTGKVIVLFEDNGPGINEDTRRQIFEPFFSTKTKGAGIGLALCKDLIAEHGGEIDVKSQEGVGTTFIVKFPSVAETAPIGS